jgi:hypothetical protein
MRGGNLMKKVLLSLILFVSVFYPIRLNVQANDVQPYVIATEGPVYGYCGSNGRITTVYVGRITLNGRGTIIKKITPIGVFDTVSNPYVKFQYTDNTNTSTIPYDTGNYNANSLTPDIGDFGACPF